ncbi:MAG: S1 RNA-binding domain-containing protein, partial [bacterium]
SVGDEMTIEVIGEDKMGRPDLRRIEEGAEATPREPRTREARGGRSERGDREGARRGGGSTARKPDGPPPAEIKQGAIIDGSVTNTTDYGAFVELAPDVTGLIHISALSEDYVRRVTDIVRTGDRVKVEVLNIDDRGRYKLRRIEPEGAKAREPEQERAAEPEQAPEPEPQPRREPGRTPAPSESRDSQPQRDSQRRREPEAQREPERRRRPHAPKEDAPPPAVETEPLQTEEESSAGAEDRW